MARITVEDCLDKVENQYDLVLLAKERTSQLNSGSEMLVNEDNDKKTVVALREIAAGKLDIEELKKNIPDIVYVYSENSSKSFLNIIKKYQLIDSWMNTNLMCIGEKTSSVLNEVKWKKIFLFSPGEEEFLLYKI